MLGGNTGLRCVAIVLCVFLYGYPTRPIGILAKLRDALMWGARASLSPVKWWCVHPYPFNAGQEGESVLVGAEGEAPRCVFCVHSLG